MRVMTTVTRKTHPRFAHVLEILVSKLADPSMPPGDYTRRLMSRYWLHYGRREFTAGCDLDDLAAIFPKVTQVRKDFQAGCAEERG